MKKYLIKDLQKGQVAITKEQLLEIPQGGGGTTGDYIPLSGTEVGKPVIGYITIENSFMGPDSENIFTLDLNPTHLKIDDGSVATTLSSNGIQVLDSLGLFTSNYSTTLSPQNIRCSGDGNFTEITPNYLSISKNNSSFDKINISKTNIRFTKTSLDNVNMGHNTTLLSTAKESSDQEDIEIEFGVRSGTIALIEDLSYFEQEKLSGGKWLDGKDIYKITQLTVNDLPITDTMIKSTVVGGTYTEYEYTKP